MAPQKRGRKTPLKKNKAPAKSLRVGDTGPSSRPRRSCATMTDMDGDKERKSGSPSDVTARAPDASGVTNGPPSEKRGNMHAAGATRAQAVDHTDTVQNSPKYEAPSTRTRSNVKLALIRVVT
uniref:Uncharacterized protein n=1 Tax=Steinernema glaseri TaxID=37863 RepID=A0A1I7YI23_9BILA